MKFKIGDEVKGIYRERESDGDRWLIFKIPFSGTIRAYSEEEECWIVDSNRGVLIHEIVAMELAIIVDSPLYKVMNEK
jgi:hypothetical protein